MNIKVYVLIYQEHDHVMVLGVYGSRQAAWAVADENVEDNPHLKRDCHFVHVRWLKVA